MFQRLPIRCMSSSGPVLWPPSETRGAPSENEGDLIPRAGWEFELPSQHDGEFSPTSYPDASVDSNAKNASESIVLEELLFAFSFGLVWTGIYEHFTWIRSVAG